MTKRNDRQALRGPFGPAATLVWLAFGLSLASCAINPIPTPASGGADVVSGMDTGGAPPADTSGGLPDLQASDTGEPPDDVPAAEDAPPVDVPGDADDDVGEDVPSVDVPAVEAPACDEVWLLETTVPLLPDTPPPQIHPDVAFDGRGLWLAYNRTDAAGNGIDVWALRLGCDLAPVTPTFPVQALGRGNDTDPHLAVSGDGVLIAWSTDTGGDPNLFVHVRSYDTDGPPRSAEELALTPAFEGVPRDAGAWLPSATGLPDGGFAVAGSWGVDEAARFQAFVQRLAPDASPVGDFVTPFLEPGVGQLYPAVATSGEGGVRVAWTRQLSSGAEDVVHTGRGDPASPFVPEPPAPALGEDGTLVHSFGAAYSAANPFSSALYLAVTRSETGVMGSEMDVAVREAGDPGAPAPEPLLLGAPGETDHTPAVAALPDGGVVAWCRTRSGIYNDLLVQRFVSGADGLEAVGEPRLLNPPDEDGDHAALCLYPPALRLVAPDVAVVVWTEGRNPELRIMGRLLEL